MYSDSFLRIWATPSLKNAEYMGGLQARMREAGGIRAVVIVAKMY